MKNKKLKLNKNSSIEEKKAALFQAQKTLQCHILLKGYPNLILGPHLQGSLIKSGTPALAKAGTGDVLSGMIGGLMAQGLETFQAAQLGAFIHGEISKLWVKEKDPISLRPTDLIELMPSYLKSLRACKSLS